MLRACSTARSSSTSHRAAGGGGWAVAAVSVDDAFCAQRLVVDGDSLLVCNGPALATDGSRSTALLDVLRVYDTRGPDAAAAALDGAYNVVACTPTRGLWGVV